MTITKVKNDGVDFSEASNIAFDTNTLYVDAVNNRVGIGNIVPATALDVTGTITSDGLTVDREDLTDLKTWTNSDVGSIDFYQAQNYPISNAFYRSLDINAGAGNAGSIIRLLTQEASSSSKQRILIANNGDISFYEDTGTSQKFFWDASTERLGIGTTSPSDPLHVVQTSGGSASLRLDNTADDVRAAFFSSAGYFAINALNVTNTAVKNISLATNGGNVGIGTSSPNANLDVGGSIIVDNTQSISVDTTLAAGSMSMGQINDAGSWGLVGLGWKGSAAGQTASFGYASQTFYLGMGDGSSSGTLASMFQISRVGGEINFNDTGLDVDFRVESDGATHMLFVDAGSNYIGINTSNPVATLAVSNGGASGIEFQPEIATNFNRITNYNRSASVYNELGIDAARIEIRPEGVRRLSVATSGVIVNEDSRSDTDFRVESDSNSNALFVDAGYNSGKGAVIIGASSAPETGVDYNIAASMLRFSDAQPVMATGAAWNFPSVPSNRQTQANRWRFAGFTLPYHASNGYRADASYAQFVCELPNGGQNGKSNLELFEIGFNYGWNAGFYMVEVYEAYYTNSGYKRYQFNNGYNPSFDLHENYGNNTISLNVLTEGTFQNGTSSVSSNATDASYYRKTVRASYAAYRGGLVVLTVPSWSELTPNGAEVDNRSKIRLLNPQ